MGVTVKPAHTPEGTLGYSNSRTVICGRNMPVVTHGDRALEKAELQLVTAYLKNAYLAKDDNLGLIVTSTTVLLAQFDLSSGRCHPIMTWDRDGH